MLFMASDRARQVSTPWICLAVLSETVTAHLCFFPMAAVSFEPKIAFFSDIDTCSRRLVKSG